MKGRFILTCGLLMLTVIIIFFLAVSFGATDFSFGTLWTSLTAFDKNDQGQQILRNIRLPRVLASFLIGAAFAVSGAMMQGVTRNPLADSGLLGINGGASLGLVLAFILFPQRPVLLTALCAFGGALLATVIIFLMIRVGRGGMMGTTLVLAGVAIGSFFSSISQALSLVFDLRQDLAFWYVGGVANVSWQQLQLVAPFLLAALAGSLLLGNSLNALVLGDQTAIALGKNPLLIRTIVMGLVMVLAGIAVSLVGSVSFIGLMVPHVFRGIVGENYRRLLPLTIIGGGGLVMLADLLARTVNPPFETPFGLVIAIIGVPFLLWQVRRNVV